MSDKELLEAIRRGENPFVTASSLSKRVDLSRERVRQRLNRIAKNNGIEKAKLGSGVVIYWEESEP